MAVNSKKPVIVNDHALEMVMRDVMDSLTELSLESAYGDNHCSFEILDICPPQTLPYIHSSRFTEREEEAEILEFAPLKRAVGQG